jgi:glycerophosphoryl diester phosphodiesterase
LPAIIAHRGYSAAYRENSPAAWQGAIAADADVIEIDVRRSTDGIFVCCHDADLKTPRYSGLIQHMTVAEISEFSAGGHPAAPRLEEAFSVISPATAILFDVKDESHIALLELHEYRYLFSEHRLIFGLHSLEAVRTLRSLGDAEIVGLLNGEEAEDEVFFDAGGNILRLWENMTTDKRTCNLQDRGHELWMTAGGWGTGREVGEFDAGNIRSYLDAGISGFLVNDPKVARVALGPCGPGYAK